jgi:RNA polymerase sigma-70 factor (ECF subfamily)
MARETAFNDVSREQSIDDAAASFVMDEDAFRAFYQRTARGLWAYLARVTGDRHLADDLLQESFYRFLRAGTKLDTEAHRRNFLYRIATNLARDARRRSLTRGPSSVAGDAIELVPSGHDAGATERSTEFTQAMARLNPRERAMIWLAYAEGATHNEIAEVLDLSPASLKPLLFRARRKLAQLLGRAPKRSHE